MTANDIRQKFLDFFADKKHKIIASDSLVPKDDPTVLFTTAGMQQFKQQFLGNITDFRRAATSQKCLRTDDLDKVGKTDCHHTFFEMLGNFSFGDYFKKEAIAWAWEFFTKILKIPEEKLWASVYNDDAEAETIWLKEIKLPKNKVVRLGDHDNFWPADAKENGPNGPCGPCSEIFYDYGKNPNCPKGDQCDPSCPCGRFTEIWNLVFTQYNRKDGGVLEPLPSKNIDTGMGLERLVAVMQGVKSNFDIDIFKPITDVIHNECKTQNIPLDRPNLCLIADHARAITFAISDGIIPSNKERGSVVKRLISDITDIILLQGGKPFGDKLVKKVVEVMKKPYPELEERLPTIINYVQQAEEDYIKTYKTRIPELKIVTQETLKKFDGYDKIKKLGEIAFKYRDTFGLSFMTITLCMKKTGVSDQDFLSIKREFDTHMNEQKERGRAASKMTGDVFSQKHIDLGVPATVFTGYDHAESTSTVLKLFINDESVQEAKEGQEVKLILDKTPFYAESGGQVGDTGRIVADKGKVKILNTQKASGVYFHIGSVEEGVVKISDVVEAEIDFERRLAIMRNHTATHLLQAALRDVLGAHVQQQGSLVAEDRLRFDFTHPKNIAANEILKLEQRVNEMILSCETVTKEFLPIAEAKKSGALAFFAEKYGDVVRVVSMGNYSKEFCGGTHLNSTGQIGLFKIISESAIAQGIRRLEAKTGLGALNYINQKEELLGKVAEKLKSPVEELLNRIDVQSQRMKQLERDVEKLHFDAIKESIGPLIENAEALNGTKIVNHMFKDIGMDVLRNIVDLIKQKLTSSVIILGAQQEANGSVLLSVSNDLIKKGIKANELIKDIAPLFEGQGGGRPELAQAGSKAAHKIEPAIKQANKIIKEKLVNQ